ncbi:MAG: site-specific integrase [Proteiniphilum sp.]|jgi:integrase|uniref:tyrosine-type recombinase/integrase n=1 Tax=Proteiniphilum sp. TaxID=1926877 RepID=UPI002B1ED00D|nr:site-specific integrase [Proteiniphilum sp.]MEA5128319.1 site-specific integrase [Proteiniphilum sp.]
MATISKVTLRKRAVEGGAKESLYLDFYPPVRNPVTMKMSRRESLGIYLYAKPKNEMEREFNQEMLIKGEAIRGLRTRAIINQEYGFLDDTIKKRDFLSYFKEKAKNEDQTWTSIYKHFENFVRGKCTFGEVTVELCHKFRDYLLNANQLKHKNKKLCQNSAAGYYSTFRGLLKTAHKEKMFKENLNDYLDRIDTADTKVEFLTLEEVKSLASTSCKYPVLKVASLVSCLTGLRISDVLNLEWENIVPASEGGYCIRIRTEKGETEATLPISNEALQLCGERVEGKVFKGLKRSMIYAPLKKWVETAGITKRITFHCFRHTFATLQIALGEDIYVVSKMLVHKHVSTTQRYADLVNAKKRQSANRISLR